MAGDARCVQKDRQMMRNDDRAHKHALMTHGTKKCGAGNVIEKQLLQRTSLAVLFSTRSVMWLMPNLSTRGCSAKQQVRGTFVLIEMEARDKHLLAGVGLLAGGNSVSHALQTLRLVLLGLGLVP
jgi:hypothetical protein